MTDFIAYYRVSTGKQGISGLGLEAQREATTHHLEGIGGRLLDEYTEVESGKHHSNRPQLQAAQDACRRRRAVLLIASLDRLARNVHFISGLLESGVPFVAVDMPTATPFEIHIRAAMAEEERRKISDRTKTALAVKKIQLAAQGKKLGNPRPLEALKLANAARKSAKPAPEVLEIMAGWQRQGKGLRAIARELNRLGIRTGRGFQWYASTVSQHLRREA